MRGFFVSVVVNKWVADEIETGAVDPVH